MSTKSRQIDLRRIRSRCGQRKFLLLIHLDVVLAGATMSKLDIVLVHGTWGRGFVRRAPVAPWCKPDSDFVRRLADECARTMPSLTTSITSFNWSGANSVLERAKAANHLQEQLKTNCGPNVPMLIIAHSHGGNVALQAITRLKNVSNIYLCTIATPYFRIFELERSFYGAETLLTVTAIAVSVAALFLVAKIIGINHSNLQSFLAVAVFIGFVGSWIISELLLRLLINPSPKNKAAPTPWQLRPRLLSEATAADATLLGDRLLILRGIDDEAALTLASGAIANRLSTLLYSLAVNIGLLFMYSLSLLIFIAGSHDAIIFFSAIAIFSIAILGLFLPPLTRLVFGTEFAFGAARCEAAFDSVPDSSQAKVITIRGRAAQKRLVHALYEDPAAPTYIASWIATHLNG